MSRASSSTSARASSYPTEPEVSGARSRRAISSAARSQACLGRDERACQTGAALEVRVVRAGVCLAAVVWSLVASKEEFVCLKEGREALFLGRCVGSRHVSHRVPETGRCPMEDALCPAGRAWLRQLHQLSHAAGLCGRRRGNRSHAAYCQGESSDDRNEKALHCRSLPSYRSASPDRLAG
jgi:hypothetical protein